MARPSVHHCRMKWQHIGKLITKKGTGKSSSVWVQGLYLKKKKICWNCAYVCRLETWRWSNTWPPYADINDFRVHSHAELQTGTTRQSHFQTTRGKLYKGSEVWTLWLTEGTLAPVWMAKVRAFYTSPWLDLTVGSTWHKSHMRDTKNDGGSRFRLSLQANHTTVCLFFF